MKHVHRSYNRIIQRPRAPGHSHRRQTRLLERLSAQHQDNEDDDDDDNDGADSDIHGLFTSLAATLTRASILDPTAQGSLD
jgi:hypothetical protein